MTQPKRPISRSSTPIEFTPLVLDLDPKVRDESGRRHGGTAIILTVVGVVVLIGILGYFGFKGTDTSSATEAITLYERTGRTSSVTPSIVGSSTELGTKKRILQEGVTNAKLLFETIDGEAVLKVALSDKVEEGISWKYDWTNNNQPLGQGDSVKGFKRGDNVAVRITPFDGENYGKAKVLTTEIKNTIPRIIGEKTAVTSDGKQLTYQIAVADADGDNLTYSLVEGPPNVIIDPKSGIISWPIASENQQKLDLKVKISDGHTGEIVYPLTVNSLEIAGEKLTAQK